MKRTDLPRSSTCACPEKFPLRALPEPCMTLPSHTASDVRPLPCHRAQWAKSVGLTRRRRSNPALAPLVWWRRRLNLRPAHLSTLLQRFAFSHLSLPCLPVSCPGVSTTLTTAAFDRSSLRLLASDCRAPRALLQLSYSCASPVLMAMLAAHDPRRASSVFYVDRAPSCASQLTGRRQCLSCFHACGSAQSTSSQ